MLLNPVGRMAHEMWLAVERYHPEYHLDECVIMPNHVHGLVRLEPGRHDGLDTGRHNGLPLLPDFVRRFKSTVDVAWRKMAGAGRCACPVTMRNGKLWHRNYWDVIVRDEQALSNIRNYIRFNPMNYQVVMQCGEPKVLGSRALLTLPTVGFLASRGKNALHGSLALTPGEAILSGFLSPMERAVFKAGLANRKPMIWVKPWALEEGIDSPGIQKALQEERLLIISPFAEQIDAPSVRRAAWCNQYVLAHCTRMVVGHLNPGGMLACILTEAPPDLDITYLRR
jgi:REP element-mobilizing transposase RayT